MSQSFLVLEISLLAIKQELLNYELKKRLEEEEASAIDTTEKCPQAWRISITCSENHVSLLLMRFVLFLYLCVNQIA